MIFFDFDGTVVDVWTRYFEAFRLAAGDSKTERESYISAKRRLCKDDLVAAELGVILPEDYYFRKKELLESQELLRRDTLLVSPDVLADFDERIGFRILTVRRNPAQFMTQLTELGLSCFAEKSVVLTPGTVSKKDFLSAAFSAGENIVIGDAASEWETAELENTRVFLVRTGLRDPADFPPRQRCAVLENLGEFIESYKR